MWERRIFCKRHLTRHNVKKRKRNKREKFSALSSHFDAEKCRVQSELAKLLQDSPARVNSFVNESITSYLMRCSAGMSHIFWKRFLEFVESNEFIVYLFTSFFPLIV